MEIKNLLHSTTSDDVIAKLEKGSETFYLGVDPTGDSMHIGHLAALIFAKRLVDKGNKLIIVLGGFTAMIGDPSGKSQERVLLGEKTIKNNIQKLTLQFKQFFGDNFTLKNNSDWLNMPLVEFLRDYGKQFNINTMIKRDIVSSRLDTGISFTEFAYQVLQGMDFAHLAKEMNCTVQLGGQDQWGNIVSGLELIRKQGININAYGITLPLITKPDGSKFGKTETGTVWIDPEKTSPYQLYQFLFNTEDSNVINLIKYLTLSSQEKIDELEKEVQNNSRERKSQRFLAEEVTTILYNKETLIRVEEITKALFSGEIKNLSQQELNQCLSDVPTSEISNDMDIQDFLILLGASKSRREAREFISNGSVMLNGEKISDENMLINQKNSLYSKLHIVKRGKRKYFVGKYK